MRKKTAATSLPEGSAGTQGTRVKRPGPKPFPIVGVGASAGGLASLEAFFSPFSASDPPGMSFVVVQHLAPDHDSILPALIQRRTTLRVLEATDGMVVEVNSVYVIPPDREASLTGGSLQLRQPAEFRGHRLPIDLLFRSLAADRLENAVAIVLSGAGNDGTLGAEAVKAVGGLVMAEPPGSARFRGMPTSVIAAGVVDVQLDPSLMAAQLLAHAQLGHKPASKRRGVSRSLGPRGLTSVFHQLRAQTGHDFSEYKPSTTVRRIERRMAVHKIDSMDDYVKYLEETPGEVKALLGELLIGVTSFFRDPEAFSTLESAVIPSLFEGRSDGRPIRVWSAGCSTGEEAYSLAILFQEQVESRRSNHHVQIFATDIDQRAIAKARAGIYPIGIAADITPERLERFFSALPDGAGYRIHQNIRDLVVFSEHNLIQNPPFSRLDLISCRNLLIYLGADLQAQLLPIFHYALSPGGFLLLGTSETLGESAGRFSADAHKVKIYKRNPGRLGHPYAEPRSLTTIRRFNSRPVTTSAPTPAAREHPRRQMTEATLLRHASLCAALVTATGDMLYLHGRSGEYLEQAEGMVGTSNILTMSREGLRAPLSAALEKAASTLAPVRVRGLKIRTNGSVTSANLTICRPATGPTPSDEGPLYLVILQDVTSDPQRPDSAAAPSESLEADLREQLQAKEEHLQAANEKLATTNEELSSSNEELQAMNEELQSTNEELETSKEEMQSMNEELVTVNAELLAKVTDLSRASNDMNNLLASTGVGTVFVDQHLCLLRFTPAATRIVNLIPSDVSRPLAHVSTNLIGYERLMPDTQAVLESLVPVNQEVQSRDGTWYAMRILPYRTLDNVVEGAVITFVDITETVLAREALRKANALLRLAVVVRDSRDAITVQDLDGHVLAWNPGAVRTYGWTEAEALELAVEDRIPAAVVAGELERLQQLSRNEHLEPYRTRRRTRSGEDVAVWITATALVDEAGLTYAIATTERGRTTKPGPPGNADDAA